MRRSACPSGSCGEKHSDPAQQTNLHYKSMKERRSVTETMKKMISLILCLALVCCLFAGCAAKTADDTTTPADTSADTAQTETPAAETETPAADSESDESGIEYNGKTKLAMFGPLTGDNMQYGITRSATARSLRSISSTPPTARTSPSSSATIRATRTKPSTLQTRSSLTIPSLRRWRATAPPVRWPRLPSLTRPV